jgi:hypothetical protein
MNCCFLQKLSPQDGETVPEKLHEIILLSVMGNAAIISIALLQQMETNHTYLNYANYHNHYGEY